MKDILFECSHNFPAAQGWPIHKMGLDPPGVPRNNNQIRVITLIEIKAKLIQVAKLYSNLLGSTIQMHVWQCMENQPMLVNVLLVI